MNFFLIFGLILCIAMGGWLSKRPFATLLMLVPLATLVPVFYGAGTLCGAGFPLHLTDPAYMCKNNHSAAQTFAGAYVVALIPVLLSALVLRAVKLWRGSRAS